MGLSEKSPIPCTIGSRQAALLGAHLLDELQAFRVDVLQLLDVLQDVALRHGGQVGGHGGGAGVDGQILADEAGHALLGREVVGEQHRGVGPVGALGDLRVELVDEALEAGHLVDPRHLGDVGLAVGLVLGHGAEADGRGRGRHDGLRDVALGGVVRGLGDELLDEQIEGLEGEIENVSDVSLGVPVVLSKKGIAMVVPIHMNDYEKEKFFEAAEIVKETTDYVLKELKED